MFRRHIRQLLLHDFPEHYGEVLNLALRGSETQSLSLEVWFDILNALMSGEGENVAPPRRLRPGQNLGKVKEETRNYATEQKMLTYQEVGSTITSVRTVVIHIQYYILFYTKRNVKKRCNSLTISITIYIICSLYRASQANFAALKFSCLKIF